MAVRVEETPNPNAMKFSLGEPVGGPATYVRGSTPEEDFAAELLEIDGVASVFMTSDFLTITKLADSSWDAIVPTATAILEKRFGA